MRVMAIVTLLLLFYQLRTYLNNIEYHFNHLASNKMKKDNSATNWGSSASGT